jgi:group I intron endonuclease
MKKDYKLDKEYTDEQLKSHGIYKIECIGNNKIYIGQTKTIHGFNARWRNHLSSLKTGKCSNGYFLHSYNKYGKDSLIFSIIEYIDKKEVEKIDKQEVYWIDYYQSCDSNFGFNIAEGGLSGNGLKGEDNPRTKLKNYEVEEIKLRLVNGENALGVAKDYNVTKNTIQSIKACKTHTDIREDLNNMLLNNISQIAQIMPIDVVREIKYRLFDGESSKSIAKDLNIIQDTIESIKKLRNWDYILPELNNVIESSIKHRKNFTLEQLKEIRLLYTYENYGQRKLGKIYGVNQKCILDIVNYNNYYSLKDNEEYIKPINKIFELLDNEINEIRQKFSTGQYTKDRLGKEYSCSGHLIGKIIYYEDKYCLKDGEIFIEPIIPKQKVLSDIEIKDICYRFENENISKTKLSKEYGVSINTIKRIIEKTIKIAS